MTRPTEAQEGLWFARRLDPDNPIQNTGQLLELKGTFDPDAFSEAVAVALAEADGLRTRIRQVGGEPVLGAPHAPARLEIIDTASEPDPMAAARASIDADMRRARNPAEDPMVTERLYVLGPDRHVWYQCIQHLVVDGYGTDLLNRRILDLYRAATTGSPPTTASFSPFQAALDEDAEYRASERRKTDRTYWLGRLSDLPPVRSFADGVPMTADTYHRSAGTLSSAAIRALHRLGGEVGAGWPDAAVALFALYLRRHIGGDEVVLGVPSMNRLGSRIARVPTMAMNVLPARISIDEDLPPGAFVAAVAARLREDRAHGRYRSEQLRRDLGLLGESRRLYGPLFNVLPFQVEPRLPGLEIRTEVLATGPVDDLTVTLRGRGPELGVDVEIDANPSLYEKEEAKDHLERLNGFFERAGERATLVSIPTLSASEARRWTEEVNDTHHPVPRATLVDLMVGRFGSLGDEIAVEGESETLTYAELDARTGALARRLRSHGVGPDSIVGILLPRSVERVVALVGVLRAGGAYLPMDPEHPPERLHQLLRLAAPTCVIADSGLRDRLPMDAPVIDSGAPTTTAAPDLPLPAPSDAAYLIFTSGSTGVPKGVLMEHEAIVNRLEWMRETFGVGPGDRILQKTPATFDVSVWEFFLPLISGATLVVAPPGVHREPGELARIVRERRITAMHFVPSMFGPFLEHPESEGLSIARVFCSGEALPAALRDRFHARIDGELHNLYGPTEAAVDVTHWPAPPEDRSDPIPIGRPVWNTRMYVLDEARRPVPAGVAGDLYIAGVQLAREYLGQPERTAEAFVTDPFGPPGTRMYRTGDLGWWRRDGAIVFGGRADHQVKIRGQRVEPGEIEAALLSLPGILQAAVVLREDDPTDPRLVAYVCLEAETGPVDPEALRAELGRRLPVAMVPSDVMFVDRLPLGATGKLDRGKLPAPKRTPQGGRAPSTPTEQSVAELFREVLGTTELPSAEADFFRLGGHSLLALRIANRVREAFGIDPGAATLFSHPSVERFASWLDERTTRDRMGPRSERGLDPVVPLSPPASTGDGSVVPPLYCVHPAGGIAWCYAPLARALSPSRATFGLQAVGLDPRNPLPATLEEMAEGYIDEIRKLHPGGPIHLAGWSVGGIVAHEIATQLAAAGDEVGSVALLDAYPSDRWRDMPEPAEGAALRALLLMAGDDPEQVAAASLDRAAVRARLRGSGHPLGELEDDVLDGVERVVEANNRLVRGHRHSRFEGRVLHFSAALDHEGEDLDADLWLPYAAEVVRIPIQALHREMTAGEPARAIAQVLSEDMVRVETTSPRLERGIS